MISILQNICFEGIQNDDKPKQCSRLKQKSVIKLLVAEEKNHVKFFKKCDVYREVFFVKKIFTNGLNMGLPTIIQGRKDSPWSRKILSGKENVPGATISKHAFKVLGHERTHRYFCLEKVETV